MLPVDLRQNHVGVGTRIVGVVQGYRPQVDWGGDSGSATIVVGGHNVRVATSGWRRRCLYILLLALLALSVVNLSITLWILKTVYFNVDGMGLLHVKIGGLEMQGVSDISQKMTVASIMSRKGEDIPINGYFNLTIHTSEEQDNLAETEDGNFTTSDQSLDNLPAYLHLNVDNIHAGTKKFVVRDHHSGKEIFRTDGKGTYVGAKRFTVTGNEGAKFIGSMQTPNLYSKGVHVMRLDSETRDIKFRCNEELRMEARHGDISSISTGDLTLRSKEGAIRFDSREIGMINLHVEGEEEFRAMFGTEEDEEITPTQVPLDTQIPKPPTMGPLPFRATAATTTTPMPTPAEDDGSPAPEEVKVYEVCVCPSGKLFAVEAAHACVPDDVVCR
ncbi:zeta-sarcoglycan-like [Macrobrachium nipponense]|uniref:zeta-sarcoglycan-like n=1 Tax=Macrobrachium nipponense TaxID=159736 RepID=UPI0030C80DBE